MKLKVDYGKPITIIPFGDIHRDSHQHDKDKWHDFLKECKENDNEQTFYLCMGDELDFMSASERKAVRDLHESTLNMFDRVVEARVLQLADELKFAKGRFIGCLGGNHIHQMQDGVWSTQMLCKELDCKFLGYASYIRLSFSSKNRRNTKASIDIFASHGKGGGQLIGSPYNTVEKMYDVFDTADIYLMGHDHHKGAISNTKLGYDQQFNMQQKQRWFGRTGSFLKGWEPNVESYIIQRMYPPTDLGAIKFDVRFRRKSDGKKADGKTHDRVVKDIRMTS
jgi:hypothetical protein